MKKLALCLSVHVSLLGLRAQKRRGLAGHLHNKEDLRLILTSKSRHGSLKADSLQHRSNDGCMPVTR